MKKITAFAAGAALALTASTAFAGGPVIVAEEPEPVVVAPEKTGGLSTGIILAGAAILAIVALASHSHHSSGGSPTME